MSRTVSTRIRSLTRWSPGPVAISISLLYATPWRRHGKRGEDSRPGVLPIPRWTLASPTSLAVNCLKRLAERRAPLRRVSRGPAQRRHRRHHRRARRCVVVGGGARSDFDVWRLVLGVDQRLRRLAHNRASSGNRRSRAIHHRGRCVGLRHRRLDHLFHALHHETPTKFRNAVEHSPVREPGLATPLACCAAPRRGSPTTSRERRRHQGSRLLRVRPCAFAGHVVSHRRARGRANAIATQRPRRGGDVPSRAAPAATVEP